MRNQLHTILILFLVGFSLSSCTAHPQLKGKVDGASDLSVKLLSYYEDDVILVDSAIMDDKGRFTFNIEGLSTGLYRIQIGRSGNLDVILQNKSFQLSTSVISLQDSLRFKGSVQNSSYLSFLRYQDKLFSKLEILTSVLEYYPKDNEYYQQTKTEFSSLQEDYRKYCESEMERLDGSYAGKLIASQRRPDIPVELNIEEQRIFLQQHMLDFVDFEDSTLLYSNLLPSRILDYLGLFQRQGMSKEVVQKEYIRGVDYILTRAMFDDRVYTFSIDFLIRGFERFNFDMVVTYIADNFELNDACENPERRNELQKKLDGYQIMAIGKKAPNISMNSIGGGHFDLFESEDKYSLIVFWATWCPHCLNIIPELEAEYSELKKLGLEVVSVSLDRSKDEYYEAIGIIKIPWVNLSDFQGWDCDAADDYFVFATPTMYLLDEDKNIIAKPDFVYEIKGHLK
jgi:thiol-disulfide isomerase/thioredoxin